MKRLALQRSWQWIGLVGLTIILSRAQAAQPQSLPVTFNYNGFSWTEQTHARDVSEALIETVGDYGDLNVSPAPETKIERNTTIVLTDAKTESLNRTVNRNLQLQIAALNTPTPEPQPTPAKSAPAAKPTTPTPAATVATAKAKTPDAIYSGTATWYRYGDPMTTASRRWPKGTKIHVVAVNSGKSVDVIVDDYGPSASTGVDLDLNAPAFEALAPLGAGKIQIKYYKL